MSYCLKGMKHCILYILFLWIAVLISDTAKGNDVSFPDISKAEWSTEKEESAKLWEFMASNDAADISLQQHNPFSQNNSFRRNLHLRSLQANRISFIWKFSILFGRNLAYFSLSVPQPLCSTKNVGLLHLWIVQNHYLGYYLFSRMFESPGRVLLPGGTD